MNKQIEEIKALARTIYETGEAIEGIDLVYASLHGADSDSETKFMRIARHLYRTGYRRQGDIVREIFAEIEKALYHLETPVGKYLVIDSSRLAELKKKCERE